MPNLFAIVFTDTARSVFVGICVLAIAFLIWFLIALLLDERRMRERQRSGLSKNRTVDLPIRVELPRSRTGSSPDGKSGKDSGGWEAKHFALLNRDGGASHCHVLRSSEKKTEGGLRWLVMALVISTTLRLAAQTADSNNQNNQTTPQTQQTSEQSVARQAAPAPPTILHSRRSFVGSGERLHSGQRVRWFGNESKRATWRD